MNVYLIFNRNDFTYIFVNESYNSHMDYKWMIFGIMIASIILSITYERLLLPCLIRILRKSCFPLENRMH